MNYYATVITVHTNAQGTRTMPIKWQVDDLNYCCKRCHVRQSYTPREFHFITPCYLRITAIMYPTSLFPRPRLVSEILSESLDSYDNCFIASDKVLVHHCFGTSLPGVAKQFFENKGECDLQRARSLLLARKFLFPTGQKLF